MLETVKKSTSTNALIGDQYVQKHIEHCNSNRSGIHSSAYALYAQSLNQKWSRTNCHTSIAVNPFLSWIKLQNQTDWKINLGSSFCEALIQWLIILKLYQVLLLFSLSNFAWWWACKLYKSKVLDTPFYIQSSYLEVFNFFLDTFYYFHHW